jgi:hypothetical protein
MITSQNELEQQEGHPISIQLAASGTMPITYSLEGAPAGVTLSNNLLIIAGTVPAGVYTFTIRATNVAGSGTQLFMLVITAPPTITSPDTLSVTRHIGGSLALTATGTGPIGFHLVHHPNGVSIDGNRLVVAHNTDPGIHPFHIVATNQIGNVVRTFTQQFTLTVGVAPTITSVSDFTISANAATSGLFTLSSDGGTPIAYSLVNAPIGVSISGSNLVINTNILGPPGTHTFTIRATNDFGVDYQNFTLVVTP